ncbi:aromatic ring-hydroxylating dioxygenase subunit alpha [Pseudohaliea sp.]|uniref:aromatic ring-hydroxylating dioxygenase subunit alpha n=1 Tax=Pseudohaliea sp. TaxID=2740289 RepID=UPI0032EAE60E
MRTGNEWFLYNCWYAAGWTNEVEEGMPLARTYLEKPVVIFRGADGRYVALDDRCCHRAAPLSMGRVEGNCIRCMYHGMKYDPSGQCVEIPGQAKVSDNHRVHSYPIVDRAGMLWLWMGDPEKADVDAIPHFTPLDDPEWCGLPKRCYLHYEANWMLIVDNLADFSHLAFVHTGTLGGSEEYATESAQAVNKLENGFEFERWHRSSAQPPYLAAVTPWDRELKVDRRNFVRMYTPGVFLMDTQFGPVGWDADEPQPELLEFRNCQYMTPETRRTSHFFWEYLRNFSKDSDEVGETLREAMFKGFFEDKVIIEEQQKLLERYGDFQPRGIASDNALSHFRRVWFEAIAKERQMVASTQPSIQNAIL